MFGDVSDKETHNLSTSLFIIALFVLLMSDKEIKNIAFEDKASRITAFPDNLTSFLHVFGKSFLITC